MENLNDKDAKMIATEILLMFCKMNGSNFIGATYRNQHGELSKYVLIADFNYGVAVDKSIAILKTLTPADFNAIIEKYKVNNIEGVKYSNNANGKLYLETGKIPKEGTKARQIVLDSIKVTKTLQTVCAEMIQKMIDNKDPETRSTRSQNEIDKYEKVTNSIKICNSTKNVHIYAMAHSKIVIEKGIYSDSEKNIETLQKDAIEKYCKYVLNNELPTTKYRNLIITTDQLTRLKVSGEELVFAE